MTLSTRYEQERLSEASGSRTNVSRAYSLRHWIRGFRYRVDTTLTNRLGALAAWLSELPHRAITDTCPRDSYKVLFICHGNVCRSPLAEIELRRQLALAGLACQVSVTSRAVSSANEGQPAFWRARICAATHGLTLRRHRSHQLQKGELSLYDRILVMDSRNMTALLDQAGPDERTRIRFLIEYVPAAMRAGLDDIPDPIHGTAADFDRVYNLLATACSGLVSEIRSTRRLE